MKTSIGLILSMAVLVASPSWAGQPPTKEQKPAQQKQPLKVQPSQQRDQEPKAKHPLLQSRRRQHA